MPDPEHTREWAVQPNGGPAELARTDAPIVSQANAPTREFAPSVEGGPAELARGGPEFAASVMEMRAQKDAADAPVNEESIKAELLADMPTTPKTPPPVKVVVKEEAPTKKGGK